jgi:hypothetical protein
VTEGKCSKKGWNWKKVQDRLLPFQDSDSVGTIHCVLETNAEGGFTPQEISSIESKYENVVASKSAISFMRAGTSNKMANIENYEGLMQFLREHIKSADKAIVGVKKLPTQIHIVRCGSTSNANN